MSIEDVERFLTKCKIAVTFHIDFLFDEKEKRTLSELIYEYDDVIQEILDLEPQDYEKGPLQDEKGYAGEWWVFGKLIQGREIYIKVKVKDLNQEGHKQLSCLCISFHFAEHPLKLPYKGKIKC